jgi:hypothetical protein
MKGKKGSMMMGGKKAKAEKPAPKTEADEHAGHH